jgi:hypothetical protein
VQLTAPGDVLLGRVTMGSRKRRGKLVRPERLAELLAQLDPERVHADDLSIDTSRPEPTAAAAQIVARL